MIGKVLALLAVPLGFVAYSSLAKASPKGPGVAMTGKSGSRWLLRKVSQFQQPDGLLVISDVWVPSSALGERRVLRFSQLGSALSTRKYITSPFGGPNVKDNAVDAKLLKAAAADFGVVLPASLVDRIRKAGG